MVKPAWSGVGASNSSIRVMAATMEFEEEVDSMEAIAMLGVVFLAGTLASIIGVAMVEGITAGMAVVCRRAMVMGSPRLVKTSPLGTPSWRRLTRQQHTRRHCYSRHLQPFKVLRRRIIVKDL